MIDLKEIKTDLENNIEKLKSKGCEVDIKEVISLQEKKNSTQTSVDELKQEKNNLSKRIGQESANGSDVNKLKAEAEKINKKIDSEVVRFNSLQSKFSDLVAQIPNLPDDDVPRGDSEDHNIVLDEVVYRKEEGLDHVEIGNKLGLLDFDLANKISGSRYVVLKGKLAQLQRALIQFMLDHAEANGYSEYYVPLIVNSESLFGTGQLPKFEEDLFQSSDKLFLIPTAEVPLTNLFRDEFLNPKDLPIKVTSHTPCFRSEAGSYGKDTRGLIRQHQFEKIELVQVTSPENSMECLDNLLANACEILDLLELPYQVIELCTGDLGFSSCKTYDIEVWMPSQNKYREISSCSNFSDFQARRANIKIKDEGKNYFAHTINGSGLAVGRTLIALIENNFDGSDSIKIPKNLESYFGSNTIKIN